ncbi:ankyrin repeat domain-containing protein [Danxiaibacter flavus]|uniref:Ankyrin repeat domain-containing protein n=1 Tax=Danxiaibacter flavus TaxID=3049108 RepID=A0ABV3ZJ10_9BACT|nr:ankyrin repeat domain-containing protein [Chitinophagaceae bacterium DXS]
MQNTEIKNELFRQAVEAIDHGDVVLLERLLNMNPHIVGTRLDYPAGGYFRDPYLLWFVADNPIRHERLPANIVEIASLLIHFARQYADESFTFQTGYALGLVVTGRIPRECGVQIELMDLLLDAGAAPGNGHGALAHGNTDAAKHLLKRGGELTLATAICLDIMDEVPRLLETASSKDLEIALVAAAFYGKADMLKLLIASGANVNAYLDASSGFHHHASALHQAVFSASLDAVKILVNAGADLSARDRIYGGIPLGWAQHMQKEGNELDKSRYAAIEAFLVSCK